ncbi:Cloroperoxidase [Acephala macrosclerotiorum]|nr:Cloroperoxidase [Acephala macrosclerotiorum]
MRYPTTVIGAIAWCASEVVAFLAAAIEYAAKMERDAHAAADIEAAVAKFHASRRAVGFDASKQYVSNQGEYAFVAPDLSTDQRGPCPGLNAMANHGYIPRNGVATIQQFIDGTYDVFGMGNSLGGFLAIYGVIFDGDATKWSIGGPAPSVSNLGLLGTPQGISGSHNKYESDVSPSRPDLYEYGNDYKVIISQFQQMFDLQPDAATANYDLSVLTPFRAARFQQLVENNPYFFNGPFSGVLVQPAAYTFIYRFMGNKSAILKSFFSITGESGNFVWTEGHEKIPDNWYKRAIGDEYTIPFFLTDVLAAALEYPQFLDIGGNTGKVNTFTGVDIKNLTGGIFDGATLLQGNNLECFVFQAVLQAAPDLLEGLELSLLNSLIGQLNTAVKGALNEITRSSLQMYNTAQFSHFPGSKGVV